MNNLIQYTKSFTSKSTKLLRSQLGYIRPSIKHKEFINSFKGDNEKYLNYLDSKLKGSSNEALMNRIQAKYHMVSPVQKYEVKYNKIHYPGNRAKLAQHLYDHYQQFGTNPTTRDFKLIMMRRDG